MEIDKELINNILSHLSSRKGLKSEVFYSSARNITAEAREGTVDALERAESSGLSIRVIDGKRHGFSYTNDVSKWREAVDMAAATAMFTEEDEHWSFRGNGGQYEGVMIYDDAAAAVAEADIVDMALDVERAALELDDRIKKVRKASASVSSGELYIANTEGLSGGYRFTSCTLSAMAMAESSGDSQIGWEYEYDRVLSAISPKRVGAGAAERALGLLNAKTFKSVKVPVVIENSVAADFLSLLASSFSSENVQKGKSILAGKLSQQIVSDKLNIIDNALLEGKAGSRPFDGEGVPSQRNALVMDGVLKGFLYNLYTASKGGGVSTGSAQRGGISGMPTVGVSNLYIEPTSSALVMTVDEMFSQAGECLFVTDAMGVHMANRITGEFSVGVSGMWVEGGKKAYPVKEAVISGNFLDMFKDVEAVGSDLRFYGKIGSPSLLIRHMDVSG
ncbi:TldD/PmbA family protein [Candidatus Magnetominusculus dajiuhuensis]|uniref:TldD/PmbA family protein n=1 Tax=Candidatus Magnetominusculus dajiuhuensis TaxID=3137712 RepID=UPI003B42D988